MRRLTSSQLEEIMKSWMLIALAAMPLFSQQAQTPPTFGFEAFVFGEYNRTVDSITLPTHLAGLGVGADRVKGFFVIGAVPAGKIRLTPSTALVLGPSFRYPVSGGTGTAVRVQRKVVPGFSGELRHSFGTWGLSGGYNYFPVSFEATGTQLPEQKLITIHNHFVPVGFVFGRVKLSAGPLFARVSRNTPGTRLDYRSQGFIIGVGVILPKP